MEKKEIDWIVGLFFCIKIDKKDEKERIRIWKNC